MEHDKIYEKIKKALIKRALGYDSSETVEEYAADGDEMTIIRKKVTKKNVPPDISAAKILLDDYGEDDLSAMSDERLAEEKERLLKLLKEKVDDENSKKRR